MLQEGRARAGSAVLVRVLKSLLLVAALGCPVLLPCAGGAVVGAQRHIAPSFRHSGSIVFEAGGEIYVVSADGGTPTKIVGNGSQANQDVVNLQPALSPDGSRVAFSRKEGGKFSIYVVGVDGQGLERVTDGPDDDSEPAWSPDGSRIAFVRGFDATGSGVVILTCESLVSDILVVGVEEVKGQPRSEVNLTNGLGGTDPSWSPDGSRIAFASIRGGYSYDIYTMSSANGQNVQRLTNTNDSSEADPAWSPDGNWIAYTGRLQEDWRSQCGNMPIIGTPTGGGGGGNCQDENSNGVCDAEENSFTSDSGPYIYRMRADGSEQKAVTKTGAAAEPDWSPDGSQIVFVGGNKGGDVDLYLIAGDGAGPLAQLTFDGAQESSPSWGGASSR